MPPILILTQLPILIAYIIHKQTTHYSMGLLLRILFSINLNGTIRGLPWVAQMVKNLSAMPETQVRSLGWEDLLEKEMAIHSSILAWRIPWTEEPGGLQFMGSQESDMT